MMRYCAAALCELRGAGGVMLDSARKPRAGSMEAMLGTLCFAGLCCFIFGAKGAKAQVAEPLKWDVVSVKPMSGDDCKAADSGGVRYLPNGLSASCVPVLFTVEFAYHLMDPTRIVGMPKWALGPQLYGIEARVSAKDAAAFRTLKLVPAKETVEVLVVDSLERPGEN